MEPIDYAVELKKFWDPRELKVHVFTEAEYEILNNIVFELDASDNEEIGEALWEGQAYYRELEDPTQKWVALFEWAKYPDHNDEPIVFSGVDAAGVPWERGYYNHVSRDGRKLEPWGSQAIHPLFRYGDFDWNQYQEAGWMLQWEPIFKKYEKLMNPGYLPELEPWIKSNEEQGDRDYLFISPAFHKAMAQTDRFVRRRALRFAYHLSIGVTDSFLTESLKDHFQFVIAEGSPSSTFVNPTSIYTNNIHYLNIWGFIGK